MTSPPRRPSYQFGTRALFGVMVLLSMLAAIAGNFVRRAESEEQHYDTFIYVVLATGSPLLVLIIVGIYYRFTRRSQRPRK